MRVPQETPCSLPRPVLLGPQAPSDTLDLNAQTQTRAPRPQMGSAGGGKSPGYGDGPHGFGTFLSTQLHGLGLINSSSVPTSEEAVKAT